MRNLFNHCALFPAWLIGTNSGRLKLPAAKVTLAHPQFTLVIFICTNCKCISLNLKTYLSNSRRLKEVTQVYNLHFLVEVTTFYSSPLFTLVTKDVPKSTIVTDFQSLALPQSYNTLHWHWTLSTTSPIWHCDAILGKPCWASDHMCTADKGFDNHKDIRHLLGWVWTQWILWPRSD